MKWGDILFLAPLSVCPSVRPSVRPSVCSGKPMDTCWVLKYPTNVHLWELSSRLSVCPSHFRVRSISFEPLVGFINNFAQMSSMMRRCAVPMFDQGTVQPARNLHKPSDPGGQNFPRAVEHRGRTPVDPAWWSWPSRIAMTEREDSRWSPARDHRGQRLFIVYIVRVNCIK